MNPEPPQNPREALEARLTALLLGELSADEAAAVRRVIEQDGELAKLFARLHHTIPLVREAAASPDKPASVPMPPLKLSEERRQKLFAQFKTVAPKEFTSEKRRARFTLVELAAVVAILGALAAITMPTLLYFSTRSSGYLSSIDTLSSAPEVNMAAESGLEQSREQIKALKPRAPVAGPNQVNSSGIAGYAEAEATRQESATLADSLAANGSVTMQAPAPAFRSPHQVSAPVTLPLAQRMAGETGFANDSTAVILPSTASSPVAPQPQIVLPAMADSGSARREKGAEDSFGIASSLGVGQRADASDANRTSTLSTTDPQWIGGLEKSGQQHSGSNRFVARYASIADGSTTGSSIERLREGLKNSGDRKSDPELQASHFDADGTIEADNQANAQPPPEVNVKAKFAEIAQDDNRALGFDWHLGNKLTKSTGELARQGGATESPVGQSAKALTQGEIATISGRTAEVVVAGVPVLGDMPVSGKLFASEALPSAAKERLLVVATNFTSYDQQAFYRRLGPLGAEPGVDAGSRRIPDGGRVTPASNVYSIELLGNADLPSDHRTVLPRQMANLGTIEQQIAQQSREVEKLRRQVSVPDMDAGGQTPPPFVESEIYRGLNRFSNRVAVGRSFEDARNAEAARVEETQAYWEAKRKLEELNLLLTNGVDVRLPRKPATNAPIPQPEVQTSENNFSTFSLNVSDVSFKLAAASLEKGQMPDAASVRSEEFINAFDYRDPEPAAGVPIAFAYERARYPFAHNRDLLRFSLKTAAAGRQAGRPLNIVLLLDNSGSMERADRVQIIREALRVLALQLQPQDKLSVIMFARTARLVADGISGDQAGEVAELVSGLTPQGGTNLEEAMNLAYQTAARHYLANGINRVVLLTDGAANLGDVEPDALKQKVEAQRKQGIALDCFGIGWEGFNDDLLEVLSRNGDGRYGFLNSPEEAATEFAGQLAGALKVAAADVKVQVEFNPQRVTLYRQIGYAKHQLTKEQFRDNTVDAAEIAAQEAGNALYTVEVNPAGQGPLGIVRVRYKIPGTTDYREQAWDVPYTGSALSLEQSSPAMRLAACASAFSEWLVASPFAGEVTPYALLGYLSGVPEIYGADSRPKKLEWMIHQAKSIEGK